MPKHYQDKAVFQFRVDSKVYEKLKAIAEKESRSLNSQVDYFVKKGLAQYEAEHGPIILPEEDQE